MQGQEPRAGRDQAPTRERWQVAGIIAFGTLLLVLLETSRNYLSNALLGRSFPWLDLFYGNAPPWVLMALLTPLPLSLARRVPIASVRRGRALAIHAGGAVAFACLHTIGMYLYVGLQRGSLADFVPVAAKASSAVAVNMMIYAALVGVVHALRFYREARARELAASQLQSSLTEARLAVLRGQLNPHFLFNTLNAIATMALAGRQDDVVQMLGYLGELLRVSLDDQRPQEVPLRSELEVLERYLDIQRARLGARLRIRQAVDPSLLDAMVPSMILQPLVENAITHGIAKIPGPGTIDIRASRRDPMLRIEVADTGPEPAAQRAAGCGSDGTGGIGLANTRARLAQLYGASHALTLASAAGGGACVTLEVPCRIVPAS
ncbi:MAG: histidine kinase [Acidobacteriota bacterium]